MNEVPLTEDFSLVLIRPDQHIAWHGHAVPQDALTTIDCISGT
jgi:hypothetical protein